jgi:hypothetical protein
MQVASGGRDGRDLTITSDANGRRVDATVTNGIVTAIGVY